MFLVQITSKYGRYFKHRDTKHRDKIFRVSFDWFALTTIFKFVFLHFVFIIVPAGAPFTPLLNSLTSSI